MLVKLYLQNILEDYYIKYNLSFKAVKELAKFYKIPLINNVRCINCDEIYETRTFTSPCKECEGMGF